MCINNEVYVIKDNKKRMYGIKVEGSDAVCAFVLVGLEFDYQLASIGVLAQKNIFFVEVMIEPTVLKSRNVLLLLVEVDLDFLHALQYLFLEQLDLQLHLELMLHVGYLVPIVKNNILEVEQT